MFRKEWNHGGLMKKWLETFFHLLDEVLSGEEFTWKLEETFLSWFNISHTYQFLSFETLS